MQHAIDITQRVLIDMFKFAAVNKDNSLEKLFNLYSYFKLKARLYTINNNNKVQTIYEDLRLGNIGDTPSSSDSDRSEPLIILTELSQAVFIKLVTFNKDNETGVETYAEVIEILSHEMSEIYTMHADDSNMFTDVGYRSTLSKDEWQQIFNTNPWLLIGALIKFTSFEVVEEYFATLLMDVKGL